MKTLFEKYSVVPVLTFKDSEGCDAATTAIATAKDLVAKGYPLMEVTLRTEEAWSAIEAIQVEVPEAIVGIGTVTKSKQLKQGNNLGVRFAVSPGLDPHLVRTAQDLDLFYLPGVATPSEVMEASKLGLSLLKFFPAEAAGGTSMLKSLAAPFPMIQFCPTGGINADNVEKYQSLSNVFCVGGAWIAK